MKLQTNNKKEIQQRRKVNFDNTTLDPALVKIGENAFGNIFATRRGNRTTAPYAFLSFVLKDNDGYDTDDLAILVTGIQSEEEAFSITGPLLTTKPTPVGFFASVLISQFCVEINNFSGSRTSCDNSSTLNFVKFV